MIEKSTDRLQKDDTMKDMMDQVILEVKKVSIAQCPHEVSLQKEEDKKTATYSYDKVLGTNFGMEEL